MLLQYGNERQRRKYRTTMEAREFVCRSYSRVAIKESRKLGKRVKRQDEGSRIKNWVEKLTWKLFSMVYESGNGSKI